MIRRAFRVSNLSMPFLIAAAALAVSAELLVSPTAAIAEARLRTFPPAHPAGSQPRSLTLETESAAPSGRAESATEPAPRRDPSLVERVSVSLVLVPVVVKDARGKPVLDLAREDFSIVEEGSPQAIEAFGRESRPVAFMLALDTSYSMRNQDLAMKKAALEFVKSQEPRAAFALEVFNDSAFLEQDFTSDRPTMENAIGALRVEGENTALYDALDAAAHHLEKREEGRVAVLFTDGTETVHPQDEAEERLSSAIAGAARRDVTVYTIAFGPRAAVWVLERIASETGGEAFKAASTKELTGAFASIAESVGSRYLLGYKPSANGGAGFRRIDVKVSRPELKVVARRGYYAR